jgi:uncharacterized protein (TIRG00374 family)
MSKKTANWGLIAKVAGVLFGITVLYALLSKIELDKTFELISGIGSKVFLIFIPFFFVSFFDTLGWKLAFPNKERRIPLFKLLSIRFITEALLMSLPAGIAVSEAMKPVLLKRKLSVPTPEGVASIALKKMLLGVAQGMYIGLSAVIGFELLKKSSVFLLGFSGLPYASFSLGLSMFLVFGFATYILVHGGVAQRFHGVLVKIPMTVIRDWLLKTEEKFSDIDNSLKKFKRIGPKKTSTSILSFFLGWLSETLDAFVILWVLGVDISYTEVLAFETILSFIRSVVFIVPAGLGIQDIGYVAFFTALGIPDPLIVGGAFVLLKRFKELCWISLGYITLFISGIRIKEIAAQTT